MSRNKIEIGIYTLTGKKLGSITQQCADIYTLTGKKVGFNCPEKTTDFLQHFSDLNINLNLKSSTNLKPV